MGRPKQTEPSNRTERVNLRLTPAERKMIEDRANAKGLKFTTYARERVLSEAR